MPETTLATFNTHAGTDGWGRPFDLVEACRRLEADVLVLQEVYARRDGVSQAEELAGELGYTAVELPLARCWRRQEPAWDGKGWEPSRHKPGARKALYVGGRLSGPRRNLEGYEEGTWGLAVLSRLRIVKSEAIELGKLRRDVTQRAALCLELAAPTRADEGTRPLRVFGTHAAHLTAGSPFFFRRLRRQLPSLRHPAVVAGDMNVWGPALSVLLPGWHRAVRGKTWPAGRRPHSQLDHILLSDAVEPLGGEVVRVGNSDHLAVRAVVAWE